MAMVVLCNRTTGKSSRIKLEGVNLSAMVSEFRSKSARQLELSTEDFELIYAGRRLQDECTLDYYGIRHGVTVHALRHPTPMLADEEPEPMDSDSIEKVVTALQAALLNRAFRNIVERMLNDSEALENIIAATPSLDKDPVAIAMLQDPELLAILADPSHIHKVIEAHPALGHAATLVAAAVNEEGAKMGITASSSSRGTYSLDQMSDEEDDGPPRPSGSSSLTGQAITTSQLAAALAAAGGTGPPILSEPSTSSSNESPQGSVITSDFFRQAMMAADDQAQASGSQSTRGQQSQQDVTQSQLQQLCDMGITDEAVARQALEATGGNIQAALELIFGDEL